MSSTSDIGNTSTHGGEGELDPRAAARLLDQTQRNAQQAMDFRSPWLTLLAAGVVLVGFGAVWLSVRDQHPFTGPSAVSLVVVYALVAIRLATVAYAARNATAGLSGPSVRAWRAEAAALATALLAAYLLMGALAKTTGASRPVVYWLYGVTATLIVMGTFWAARSAVLQDWPGFGVSVAVMLVAALSACAGPRGMWLGDSLGCCAVLLGHAAVQTWLPRVFRPQA